MANSKNDDFYLYLDFGGEVNNDIFDKPIHLRIANLHKENPLVQLNERVFKGTFENAMGTNLFFEINENQIHSDIYGRKASVHLNYFGSQSKVLNLEPVKIKPRKPEVNQEHLKIKYNLNWDYDTLLKKWDDGTLELNDMIKNMQIIPSKEKAIQIVEDTEERTEEYRQVEVQIEQNNSKKDEHSVRELAENYQQLKLLAKRPVKRKIVEEEVENCDDKYKKAYEFHNIEKQVLKPSDAFRTENFIEIDENNLTQCIDVSRCVLYGILKPSIKSHKTLTPIEKTAVLSLDNFDNLSLSARYYVISNVVEKLKKQLENLSNEELQKIDQYERTFLETLDIYQKLCDSLHKRIAGIKEAVIIDDDNTTDNS